MNRRERRRIAITTSCNDAAKIPKVSGAGKTDIDPQTGRTYQLMHNGLKVYDDTHFGPFMTEVICRLQGHHEPQEEWVFHLVLPEIPAAGVMVELGAHWSYYSMWFLREVEQGRTYMIEANSLQPGRDNFALNGFSEADFTQAFVAAESRAAAEVDDGSDIPHISVDDFSASKGLDRIHLLHSDIQGAEREMLSGARRMLREHRIDFLFISTHGPVIHRDCRDHLEQLGYRLITEHTILESYSADGLLVACRPGIEIPEVQVSKRRSSPRKALEAWWKLAWAPRRRAG